jgi:hypothetical protein
LIICIESSEESTTTATASENVKPLLPKGPEPRRYVNIATGLGTERRNPFKPGTTIKLVKGQQLQLTAASGEGPHVKNTAEQEEQSLRRAGGKRRRKKRPVTIIAGQRSNNYYSKILLVLLIE